MLSYWSVKDFVASSAVLVAWQLTELYDWIFMCMCMPDHGANGILGLFRKTISFSEARVLNLLCRFEQRDVSVLFPILLQSVCLCVSLFVCLRRGGEGLGLVSRKSKTGRLYYLNMEVRDVCKHGLSHTHAHTHTHTHTHTHRSLMQGWPISRKSLKSGNSVKELCVGIMEGQSSCKER